MIIRNITLSFEHLKINHLDLDFSQFGIYLLCGNNGTGKTSIIEQIIFNQNKIEFNTPDQAASYQNRRFNLISYVPQSIPSYDVPISEYITKGEQVELDLLNNFMHQLGLSSIRMTQRFNELSGGEKVKVAIVAALLKDAPYVFLDEPTNSLDDESVASIKTIIEAYADRRTFVIVSHDPRLRFDQCCRVDFSDLAFRTDKMSTDGYLNTSKPSGRKMPVARIVRRFLNLRNNLFRLVLLMIIPLFILFYGQNQLDMKYSNDPLPPENIIYTYKADYSPDGLNSIYLRGTNLKIDDNRKYTVIQYADLPDISRINGISQILAADYEYLDKIEIQASQDNLLAQLHLLSIPAYLSVDAGVLDFFNYHKSLETGRLPEDDKFEIALSKNQLKSFFGYTDEMLKTAIGETILVNDQPHEIVGLSFIDIAFVSYSREMDYGFYAFNEDSFNRFMQDNINYKLENSVYSPYDTDYLLIYTDQGREKAVLNELFQKYPAENFYSPEYALVWMSAFNREVINNVYAISMVYSIIMASVLLFIERNKAKIDQAKIKDYQIHYVNKKTIKASFIILNGLQYLLVFSLALFLTWIGRYGFILVGVMLSSLTILYIPGLMYLFWRLRHD